MNKKHLRNLKKILRIIASMAGTLLLIFLLVFLFKSPLFEIKKVNCQKKGGVCTEKERSLLASLQGKNIFLLRINKEKKALKNKLPKVAQIKFSKKLPNQLNIQLFPRKALLACTKSGETWYLVDQQGVVFEQEIKQPNLPVFKVNQQIKLFVGEQLAEKYQPMVSLAEELKNSQLESKKIEYEQNMFTLWLQEDAVASISGEKSLSSQVGSLQFILRQSKIEGRLPKFIDLRFNKPVIKY